MRDTYRSALFRRRRLSQIGLTWQFHHGTIFLKSLTWHIYRCNRFYRTLYWHGRSYGNFMPPTCWHGKRSCGTIADVAKVHANFIADVVESPAEPLVDVAKVPAKLSWWCGKSSCRNFLLTWQKCLPIHLLTWLEFPWRSVFVECWRSCLCERAGSHGIPFSMTFLFFFFCFWLAFFSQPCFSTHV